MVYQVAIPEIIVFFLKVNSLFFSHVYFSKDFNDKILK